MISLDLKAEGIVQIYLNPEYVDLELTEREIILSRSELTRLALKRSQLLKTSAETLFLC